MGFAHSLQIWVLPGTNAQRSFLDHHEITKERYTPGCQKFNLGEGYEGQPWGKKKTKGFLIPHRA